MVVDSGVGDITSSDVINAKTGNAYIFAFETKIPNDIAKLAEAEKIKVDRFEIIYELLQALKKLLKKEKLKNLDRARFWQYFPLMIKKLREVKLLMEEFQKETI